LIIEYWHRQLTLIQNHSTTSPHVMQVTPPIPSPNIFNITSPEPESLPTHPWFIYILSKDIPQNPPNSLVHLPQEILPPTTVYPPQCMGICFMSSKPSEHGYDIPSTSSPLEENRTVIVTHVVSLDPLYSYIFHCDEDILEELNTPDFLWNSLHHRALFLA